MKLSDLLRVSAQACLLRVWFSRASLDLWKTIHHFSICELKALLTGAFRSQSSPFMTVTKLK